MKRNDNPKVKELDLMFYRILGIMEDTSNREVKLCMYHALDILNEEYIELGVDTPESYQKGSDYMLAPMYIVTGMVICMGLMLIAKSLV